MILVTGTVTADTSGNVSIPVGAAPAAPGQPVYLVPAAAVILLGAASGSAAGATLPANVPVPIPAGVPVFVRAPSATVAVSYYYLAN